MKLIDIFQTHGTVNEDKEQNIAQLRKDYENAMAWVNAPKNEVPNHERAKWEQKAIKMRQHAKTQYKIDLAEAAKVLEGATFELMAKNGNVKRFQATSREEAIKIAKAASAKSLIRCTPYGVPVGKPIQLDEEAVGSGRQVYAQAAAKSKQYGVVQHVNKDKKTGKMYVSDFYDDDETVATFNKGKLKESADLAKKLVRGEQGPKGLLAKLDHWLSKMIVDKDANRFLPAASAVKALKSYGFNDDQVHKIREAAAEAAQTAVARMQKKHGYAVPDKYISKMGSSFAVFDLYLNVSEAIHKEFAALMRQLFDAKIDKLKDELVIVKEAVAEPFKKFTKGQTVTVIKTGEEVEVISQNDIGLVFTASKDAMKVPNDKKLKIVPGKGYKEYMPRELQEGWKTKAAAATVAAALSVGTADAGTVRIDGKLAISAMGPVGLGAKEATVDIDGKPTKVKYWRSIMKGQRGMLVYKKINEEL